MAVLPPTAPIEGNPFKSRTVEVPTGFAMEWSQRDSDTAGVSIPGVCKNGLTIAANTKTLVVYNNSSTDGIALVCLDTYETLVDIGGGTYRFPTIVNAGTAHDYMILPPGAALTLGIGPVGDRMLTPAVYVQSLTGSVVVASFACINTSGNLTLRS